MVSSLMMDFSIRSHFRTLWISASEELEEKSLKIYWKHANFISWCKNFEVCFSSKGSFQTGKFKKKNEFFRTSFKQSTKKLEFGHWTTKNGSFKSHTYIKNTFCSYIIRGFLIYSRGTIGRWSPLGYGRPAG